MWCLKNGQSEQIYTCHCMRRDRAGQFLQFHPASSLIGKQRLVFRHNPQLHLGSAFEFDIPARP
jgi:hypothetical protein